MIPQEELHPQTVQMLSEYLYEEINKSLGERRELEDKWKHYHTVYRALPKFQVKTFPFHGASNLVIPVAATDVDVVVARLLGILFAPDNVFSTRAIKPEMVEFAPRLREYLQAVQFRELDTYNVFVDWVNEIVKLGTGILKTRYRREHKTVYEYRELAGEISEGHTQTRIKDYAQFAHVSLFDFLQPASALNIQDSPWVSERVSLSWQQYMNRVREGIYIAPPRIANWSANSKGSHVLEHLMQLDSYRGGAGDKLDFWETWLDFDVQGVSKPRSVVATMHLPTWSLVRLDWNPHISQEKPYDAARFNRNEKRFYGIGMIEMLDQFQDEVTAMHNQRIDSGTLANSMVFKGRTGVVSEDEPIFPGRWFILDDLNDIDTMSLSSGKFDSSIQYEPITMQYAKNRTGVNEHVAGQFAPSIGYATAMTNIQQLQQATQRFDQTLREIRSASGNAVMRAVELTQQFDRPGRAFEVLGEKDGEIFQRFIQFPIEQIRQGVAIEVTATSASLNKEVEIRTNTILMQMLSQFYKEVLEGLMLAFNPNIPPQLQAIIFQMIQGGTVLMRRILDLHGVQDADDLVPHIRELLSGNLPIGQLAGEALPVGGQGPSGINGGFQGGMLPQANGDAAARILGGVGNGAGAEGVIPFTGSNLMLP